MRQTAAPTLAVGEVMTRPILAREAWNDTGILLVAGQEYRLTATGRWVDWYIPCDADGFASPNPAFWPFEWLRRAPAERWFALVGALERDPRTMFLIGAQRTVIAPASGELTCFANDVWLAYWNNRGALQLTVERVR